MMPDPMGRGVGAALRRGISPLITLLVVVLALGAVIGLRGILAERAQAVEGPPPEPPVAVATEALGRTDGFTVTRRFVGTVEAVRRTDVAFELAGVVEAVTVDQGDLVPAGAELARLDTALLDAERDRLAASIAALEARAELARRTLARQAELNDRGFASDQLLDEASLTQRELVALIAETRAALAGVRVRLDKSILRAPYDARVADRFLDDGAVVAVGQPLASLIEEQAPRMRVGIDPDLARGLAAGDTALVEIGGRRVPARIERLAPDLDPVTRTRIVLVTLDMAPAQAVGLYGRTGMLVLDQPVVERGAWVPVAALREGTRGTWTILTLAAGDTADAPGTVAMEAVEIVHTDGARAFVRGTFPDGARVITAGPHRVVPGQAATAAAPTAPAPPALAEADGADP